ncbi:hypothetical protein MAIT1_04334 [Magnetofaba australis IT-1]|uniref:Uncharacterized protein n=1 Tax=Magnetofaba australis IT-1 TaxID=1434232 RepID=A0A1Y2K4W4_9PROT|nr:hypothetical protein MAIT1_04334 [Magnetofaba australis IT-1]
MDMRQPTNAVWQEQRRQKAKQWARGHLRGAFSEQQRQARRWKAAQDAQAASPSDADGAAATGAPLAQGWSVSGVDRFTWRNRDTRGGVADVEAGVDVSDQRFSAQWRTGDMRIQGDVEAGEGASLEASYSLGANMSLNTRLHSEGDAVSINYSSPF